MKSAGFTGTPRGSKCLDVSAYLYYFMRQKLIDLISSQNLEDSLKILLFMMHFWGFIHWYIGQGMEEGDFSNARDLMSLIYADYKEADAGDDENRT